MNQETFEAFENYCVAGAETDVTRLSHLSPQEQNRLEQEKIPHHYAVQKIREMLALEPVL